MADKEAADQIEENFIMMGPKVVEYARRKNIKGSNHLLSLLEPDEGDEHQQTATSGKCTHTYISLPVEENNRVKCM